MKTALKNLISRHRRGAVSTRPQSRSYSVSSIQPTRATPVRILSR
ncbi:MAG: hypothetical protein QOF76_4988 [Solirubrobacteraceae bacterium]|jgi:hypothetical protein|nr:hypothetical protein [Solirubrobacteraceae bacterium]